MKRDAPLINTQRILTVKSYSSAPTKRDVQNAKRNMTCIDLTEGEATKAVLYLDNGFIILTDKSVGCFVKYFPNQKVIFGKELSLQSEKICPTME
jgi:regulator of extracellular matrix RemA (YlzA/DUF370 family)